MVSVGMLELGREQGRNEVISACSFYHKYGIDGTTSMLCSQAVNEKELVDQVVQHASQPLEKPKRKK
jgi:hypothetical protein